MATFQKCCCSELGQDLADEIAIARGNSGGSDEDIRLKPRLELFTMAILVVAGNSEQNRLSPRLPHCRRQRQGIAVDDAAWSRRLPRLYELVAGGNNSDTGLAIHRHEYSAERGEHADFGGRDHRSRTHSHRTGGDILPLAPDVLPLRRCRSREHRMIPLFSLLDRDDRIRTFRHRRAGHDLDAGSCGNCGIRLPPRRDVADDRK